MWWWQRRNIGSGTGHNVSLFPRSTRSLWKHKPGLSTPLQRCFQQQLVAHRTGTRPSQAQLSLSQAVLFHILCHQPHWPLRSLECHAPLLDLGSLSLPQERVPVLGEAPPPPLWSPDLKTKSKFVWEQLYAPTLSPMLPHRILQQCKEGTRSSVLQRERQTSGEVQPLD